MDDVLFISHTWLSDHHPDPNGVKASLLRRLLDDVIDGTLEVRGHWTTDIAYGSKVRKQMTLNGTHLRSRLSDGYVWLDYWSIPQADRVAQQRAVASIASYIPDAAFFFVLAGPWVHENGQVRDLNGWGRRGWCALEQLVNALSPSTKPIVCACSASNVLSYGPGGVLGHGWLHLPVGHLDFTVEADRRLLGPVIEELARRRAEIALTEGDLITFRVLRACEAHLLSGTGFPVRRHASLDEWLAELRFDSARALDSGERSGMSALRCAVLAGRIDFVRELILRGADVEAPLAKELPQFEFFKGFTILHTACMRNDADIVRALLEAGADTRATDCSARAYPLTYACGGRNLAVIDALMAHDPGVAELQCGYGGWPFGYAAQTGHSEVIAHLISRYPEIMARYVGQPDGAGFTMAHLAVSTSGDVRTLVAVCNAGCDANEARVRPPMPQMRWLLASVDAAYWVYGGRASGLIETFALATRCSTLHMAAYHGHLGAVRALINQCGAEVNSTLSPRQMTPLMLAAVGGHDEIAVALLYAGARTDVLDARKRTAAHWARQRGHHSLARLLEEVEASSRSSHASSSFEETLRPALARLHEERMLVRRSSHSSRQSGGGCSACAEYLSGRRSLSAERVGQRSLESSGCTEKPAAAAGAEWSHESDRSIGRPSADVMLLRMAKAVVQRAAPVGTFGLLHAIDSLAAWHAGAEYKESQGGREHAPTLWTHETS